MAAEIRSFTVSVPKGGTAAAPQRFLLDMPPRIVQWVELFFPAGNGGQLWIALGMAGTRIIPANAGAYLTADNDTLKWPLDNYPNSGAWQLFAYNSGSFAHLIQIRFLLAIPGIPQQREFALSDTVTLLTDRGGTPQGGGGGGVPNTFTALVTNAALKLAQGGDDTTTVQITEVSGVNDRYTVTVVGLPTGVAPDIRDTANKLIKTIRLAASMSAAVGSYTGAVQVSAGGLTLSVELDFTVTAAVQLPTVFVDGATHHLAPGVVFALAWKGYPNTRYFLYTSTNFLVGNVMTDTDGQGRFNSGDTRSYAGMDTVWLACPTNDASSALCLRVRIVSP